MVEEGHEKGAAAAVRDRIHDVRSAASDDGWSRCGDFAAGDDMKGVQADKLFIGGRYYGAPPSVKRWKARYERRRAKRDAECGATYTKYRGWYW